MRLARRAVAGDRRAHLALYRHGHLARVGAASRRLRLFEPRRRRGRLRFGARARADADGGRRRRTRRRGNCRRARLDGGDRADRGAALDGARTRALPRRAAIAGAVADAAAAHDLRRRRLDSRRRLDRARVRAYSLRFVHRVGPRVDRLRQRGQRSGENVRLRDDHRDGRGLPGAVDARRRRRRRQVDDLLGRPRHHLDLRSNFVLSFLLFNK